MTHSYLLLNLIDSGCSLMLFCLCLFVTTIPYCHGFAVTRRTAMRSIHVRSPLPPLSIMHANPFDVPICNPFRQQPLQQFSMFSCRRTLLFAQRSLSEEYDYDDEYYEQQLQPGRQRRRRNDDYWEDDGEVQQQQKRLQQYQNYIDDEDDEEDYEDDEGYDDDINDDEEVEQRYDDATEEYEEEEEDYNYDEMGGNYWSNPVKNVDGRDDNASTKPPPSLTLQQPQSPSPPPDQNRPQNRKRKTKKQFQQYYEESIPGQARRKTFQSKSFRSGMPTPPNPLKQLYDRLFWYGFNPDESITSSADRTMFGGTRGKFNGLEVLRVQEEMLGDGGTKKNRGGKKRSRGNGVDVLRRRKDVFDDDDFWGDNENDDDDYDYEYEQRQRQPQRRQRRGPPLPPVSMQQRQRQPRLSLPPAATEEEDIIIDDGYDAFNAEYEIESPEVEVVNANDDSNKSDNKINSLKDEEQYPIIAETVSELSSEKDILETTAAVPTTSQNVVEEQQQRSSSMIDNDSATSAQPTNSNNKNIYDDDYDYDMKVTRNDDAANKSIYNSNNAASSPRKQPRRRQRTAPANDPPTPLRPKTLQRRRLAPEPPLRSRRRQSEREEYQEPSPQRRRRRNQNKNNNEMSFGAQVVDALRRRVTKQSKSASEIVKNWDFEDDFNEDEEEYSYDAMENIMNYDDEEPIKSLRRTKDVDVAPKKYRDDGVAPIATFEGDEKVDFWRNDESEGTLNQRNSAFEGVELDFDESLDDDARQLFKRRGRMEQEEPAGSEREGSRRRPPQQRDNKQRRERRKGQQQDQTQRQRRTPSSPSYNDEDERNAIPPNTVEAWGPNGSYGMDARTKAALDATKDIDLKMKVVKELGRELRDAKEGLRIVTDAVLEQPPTPETLRSTICLLGWYWMTFGDAILLDDPCYSNLGPLLHSS